MSASAEPASPSSTSHDALLMPWMRMHLSVVAAARGSSDAPSVDCGGCGGGSGAPEGRGNSRAERKLRHKAVSNGQPCKGWWREPWPSYQTCYCFGLSDESYPISSVLNCGFIGWRHRVSGGNIVAGRRKPPVSVTRKIPTDLLVEQCCCKKKCCCKSENLSLFLRLQTVSRRYRPKSRLPLARQPVTGHSGRGCRRLAGLCRGKVLRLA